MIRHLYCTGYYSAGAVDFSYSTSSPLPAIDGGYYTYSGGAATAANGAYSVGAYSAGAFDSTYNSAIPVAAIDGGYYYTYSSGAATAANGNYSNGAFAGGIINESVTGDYIASDTNACTNYSSGVANGPGYTCS